MSFFVTASEYTFVEMPTFRHKARITEEIHYIFWVWQFSL